MNSIQKLTEIFSHFPGIGPRQARRFVYYLLTRQDSTLRELSGHILSLKNEITVCTTCQRFFETKNSSEVCSICNDQTRDMATLMIVPRDIDLESVEKNGVYQGMYFVLGSTVPILDKEPEKRIRIKKLELRIKEDLSIKEIILGVNANPEGENTANYIEKYLEDIIRERNIKVSHLGKGLSTGAELEYTDPDTLKNALRNRT